MLTYPGYISVCSDLVILYSLEFLRNQTIDYKGCLGALNYILSLLTISDNVILQSKLPDLQKLSTNSWHKR